jgi:hypothetical protein
VRDTGADTAGTVLPDFYTYAIQGTFGGNPGG